MEFGEVTFSMTQVQDTVQEKYSALRYENGNLEAQWTDNQEICVRYYS
jgi:hypothetical protein